MLCENGIDGVSCKVISQLLFNRGSFALQKMPFYVVKGALLRCKIILKIQLVENKEVTLLVELNW